MSYLDSAAYIANLSRSTERPLNYENAGSSMEVGEWQIALRRALGEKLGLPRIGRQALDLAPVLIDRMETERYTREKWQIATEPGVQVPFYLLLPRGAQKPCPLVITPHGHGRRGKETYVGNYASDEERRSGEEGERDIAVQAVMEGYAVIAPDVRGFWEMACKEDLEPPSNRDHSCAHLQRIALMYGRTLIGERVHDMGRLIDYAQTRAEIDAGRIVMTGNSGGGTVTLFAAALDSRISIAIPGSYVCTFEDSIIPIEHCPCNIIPGVLELAEMSDIAGLIAPRPLLVVHGAEDGIYPIAGTRKAYAAIRDIYARMGAGDRCELYVGDGGHRYYKERVWPFVSAHLGAGGVPGAD